MTTIEVNLDDYLDDDTKREIAEHEFREAIKRDLKTPNDVERFMSNIAWTAVQNEVEKADPDFREKLKAKVTEVLDKVTLSMLIWDEYAILHRKKSVALEVIEETVKGNRSILESAVREKMGDPEGESQFLWTVQQAINDAVSDMFSRARKLI